MAKELVLDNILVALSLYEAARGYFTSLGVFCCSPSYIGMAEMCLRFLVDYAEAYESGAWANIELTGVAERSLPEAR